MQGDSALASRVRTPARRHAGRLRKGGGRWGEGGGSSFRPRFLLSSSVTFERKTRGNSPRLAHSPSVFEEDSFQNRDWFIINNVHPEYGKEKEEDHFDHGSFFLRPSRSEILLFSKDSFQNGNWFLG